MRLAAHAKRTSRDCPNSGNRTATAKRKAKGRPRDRPLDVWVPQTLVLVFFLVIVELLTASPFVVGRSIWMVDSYIVERPLENSLPIVLAALVIVVAVLFGDCHEVSLFSPRGLRRNPTIAFLRCLDVAFHRQECNIAAS